MRPRIFYSHFYIKKFIFFSLRYDQISYRKGGNMHKLIGFYWMRFQLWCWKFFLFLLILLYFSCRWCIKLTKGNKIIGLFLFMSLVDTTNQTQILKIIVVMFLLQFWDRKWNKGGKNSHEFIKKYEYHMRESAPAAAAKS